jgi:hypothetical protein
MPLRIKPALSPSSDPSNCYVLRVMLASMLVFELVLDRPLVPPRHKDQRVNPCRDGLFGRILNKRLVDDRQQLLQHRIGGRQEAGAETGNGNYWTCTSFVPVF